MKITEETVNQATTWSIKELYTYITAYAMENTDVQEIVNKVKNGINIKLNINYYIQPTMQKYLQNKGKMVYLYKKPLTTLDNLYEELDLRKATILNTLINLQQRPALIGR